MPINRILIVDDAEADRLNLQRIVRAAGYEVQLADSGRAGYAVACAMQPDLIFMDIQMADGDGFFAARRLRKDASTASIPLVMVSSKSQKADRLWAQMQGAKGFVAKPYTYEQILQQIRVLE